MVAHSILSLLRPSAAADPSHASRPSSCVRQDKPWASTEPDALSVCSLVCVQVRIIRPVIWRALEDLRKEGVATASELEVTAGGASKYSNDTDRYPRQRPVNGRDLP